MATATREEQRKIFRQNAIAAWIEYQITGLQIDGHEVIAWLETWGGESEHPAPICCPLSK